MLLTTKRVASHSAEIYIRTITKIPFNAKEIFCMRKRSCKSGAFILIYLFVYYNIESL